MFKFSVLSMFSIPSYLDSTKSLLFVCLSVASVVLLFPSLVHADTDELINSAYFLNDYRGTTVSGNNPFTLDSGGVSGYDGEYIVDGASGDLYPHFVASSSITKQDIIDSGLNYYAIWVNESNPLGNYSRVVKTSGQDSSGSINSAFSVRNEVSSRYFIGKATGEDFTTYNNFLTATTTLESFGSPSSNCPSSCRAPIGAAWSAKDYSTEIMAVTNRAEAEALFMTIIEQAGEEEYEDTWIDSIQPVHDSTLTSSSSIPIQFIYHVDSDDVPLDTTVTAVWSWSSFKSYEIEGTFEEEVTVFDSLHVFDDEIDTINATGTIDVYLSLVFTTIEERPWWNPFASDSVTVEKIATDYTKFYILEPSTLEERQRVIEEREAEQYFEEQGTETETVPNLTTATTNFISTLLQKHPFAWVNQTLDLIGQTAIQATSSEPMVIPIPLFTVVDGHASTSLDFEAYNNYTGPRSATSSPLVDGCEFLNEAYAFSSTTTACGFFRQTTGYILYLILIAFVGLLLYKLVNSTRE